MTPDSVLEHPPLVLDQRARERYFEDGFLTVPGYVGAAWLDRLRAVVAAKIEESRALTASDDQFDLAPDHSRGEAEYPSAAQGRGPAPRAVGVRAGSRRGRPRRRSARPRRALPQLEAQLQVVGGRRRRALAPGHPGLAAHELRRADLRRLPRRHGPRAGTADGAARHASRADLRAVRRRGPVDGRRPTRDVATLPTDSGRASSAGRRAPSSSSTAAWCTARPPTTRRACARSCSTCTRRPTPCPSPRCRRPTSRTGLLVRGQEPAHVHMEPYPARLPPRWDQVGYRSIFAAQTAATGPAWVD